MAAALLLSACGGGGGGGSSGGGGVTPPAPVTFNVVAAGDIAQCGSSPAAASAAAKTAALVGAQDVLVLTLGDNAYEVGSADEFANCFQPTWGAFKDRIRPALGNHDYYTPDAAGYFGYFGTRAGPDTRGYYSFDFNGWHFISLNSMIDTGPGSAQYQWLASDLAASNALCTIAYWHFPAFSSGEKHGSYAKMQPMFAALQGAGVEIVLAGDEHLYERFAPQNGLGVADPARGVRQFVVGTGGASLYTFAAPLPNSEVRYNATHGILRLNLGTDRYSWEFVPTSGTFRDSGSDTCHR
jgi:hypothetical protein